MITVVKFANKNNVDRGNTEKMEKQTLYFNFNPQNCFLELC